MTALANTSRQPGSTRTPLTIGVLVVASFTALDEIMLTVAPRHHYTASHPKSF